MYGIIPPNVSKQETKFSSFNMKLKLDGEKDYYVNWANDVAEAHGIMARYSPTRLR